MTDHPTAAAARTALAVTAMFEEERGEVERLRRALEVYADERNWINEREFRGFPGFHANAHAVQALTGAASDEGHAESPFACDTCQDEGVVLEPDPKEAPTYESGPYAASRPCPDCSALPRMQMADFLNLEVAVLDSLKGLAVRSHDGSVTVRQINVAGLPWIEASVLLTDMGDVAPLHTFLVSPKGVVKDPGYVQGAAA